VGKKAKEKHKKSIGEKKGEKKLDSHPGLISESLGGMPFRHQGGGREVSPSVG